ncbi:helix-turn-helix domain-containing protein [Neorhizobium alkalisoli]|nr:AraC family transcriptional regulator [Neorhizobium alkalisoli]
MSSSDFAERPVGPHISSVRMSAITVTRMRSEREDLPIAPPNAPDEAFYVITQLADMRHHRLWRGGNLVYDGGHTRGALAITDLREEWQCQHLSAFDNVRFQIPFAHIRAFALEIGRPEFTGLNCPAGTRDDVVLGLTQALLPALDDPNASSRLFLEQVTLAILTHLTQTYGGIYLSGPRKGVLAPWQEKRATEFLAAHINVDFSIAQLAEKCDLSRSYFIKAFRATFGRTPYRWLLEYRVARAKDLLLSQMPIAEVAVACGFADQSHMTRVFSDIAGEPPGNWRRLNRLQ